jgi:hypothetical protein
VLAGLGLAGDREFRAAERLAEIIGGHHGRFHRLEDGIAAAFLCDVSASCQWGCGSERRPGKPCSCWWSGCGCSLRRTGDGISRPGGWHEAAYRQVAHCHDDGTSHIPRAPREVVQLSPLFLLFCSSCRRTRKASANCCG